MSIKNLITILDKINDIDNLVNKIDLDDLQYVAKYMPNLNESIKFMNNWFCLETMTKPEEINESTEPEKINDSNKMVDSDKQRKTSDARYGTSKPKPMTLEEVSKNYSKYEDEKWTTNNTLYVSTHGQIYDIEKCQLLKHYWISGDVKVKINKVYRNVAVIMLKAFSGTDISRVFVNYRDGDRHNLNIYNLSWTNEKQKPPMFYHEEDVYNRYKEFNGDIDAIINFYKEQDSFVKVTKESIEKIIASSNKKEDTDKLSSIPSASSHLVKTKNIEEAEKILFDKINNKCALDSGEIAMLAQIVMKSLKKPNIKSVKAEILKRYRHDIMTAKLMDIIMSNDIIRSIYGGKKLW